MRLPYTGFRFALPYILFIGVLAALSLAAYQPVRLMPHPALAAALFEGSAQAYLLPGQEMEIFRRVLPSEGRFSLILDEPYQESVKIREFHHAVQNYLAPLIINGEPGEKHALVYCEDIETADRRMRATGYRLLYPVAEGKAVAVRRS